MTFERVIPGREVINKFNQCLTPGENALLDYLDINLKKDNNFNADNSIEEYNGWLIFVQPYLNGSRPDIIIVHPRIGVQIFEVKDVNIDNYSFQKENDEKLHLYVSNSSGSYPVKSPKKQVEYYHAKLTGLLVPQIGEIIDENISNYGLVRTALYFHNASTIEVQELFNVEIEDFKKLPAFGNDFLKTVNLREIVPNSYLYQSKYWKTKWNTEILSWLMPPYHSLQQTTKLALTNDQMKFAEPCTGHHRVRGVAGSGKTQVLAYRAAKLASQGKKVLVLTYNITLWHFINDMIKRAPFEFDWKNITRNHFHGFCRDILYQYSLEWPENNGDEDFFRSDIPRKVLETIEGRNMNKYDAILIDEGQDYYIEWYQMLCKFLSDNDEMVVVCDKKQNVYGRTTEWLDKRRKGTEKFGEWVDLKKIIRLPEKVSNIAKEFADKFELNQDMKIEKIEKPDLFNQFDDHFLWWQIEKDEWLKKIEEAFDTIRIKGKYINASDFVILLPDKEYGNKCVEFFKSKKNILSNHVFETSEDKYGKRKKMAFWMGDSRLKISTIQSFKGWESLNVILYIPEKIIGDVKLFDMLVYTAITRTKQNIIIINSNERYKTFGADKSKEW